MFNVVITLRRDDMTSRRSVTTTILATLITRTILSLERPLALALTILAGPGGARSGVPADVPASENESGRQRGVIVNQAADALVGYLRTEKPLEDGGTMPRRMHQAAATVMGDNANRSHRWDRRQFWRLSVI